MNNWIVATEVPVTGASSPVTRQTVSPPAFRQIAACLESERDLPGMVAAVSALARGRSARVIVLHVNVTAQTAAMFPEAAGRRDIESDAEARALVDEAVRRMRRSGVTASGQVLTSGWQATADVLLDAAATFRSDLILVMPHGRTGLAAILEGSVSHQLLQRALCPVLCLPPGSQRLNLRRLAVAWDGSALARMALKLAEQVSRVFGSEVTPIRVTNKAPAAGFPASSALTSEVVIEQGSETVAEALNRAAGASKAGMVVIGSHGRGDLAALVIGSVTHGLLAISQRPVLVVRGGSHGGSATRTRGAATAIPSQRQA